MARMSSATDARAKQERAERVQASYPRKTIDRHPASETPLRAITVNDFAKLGTALGGRPTIVERLPHPSRTNAVVPDEWRRPWTPEPWRNSRQVVAQGKLRYL